MLRQVLGVVGISSVLIASPLSAASAADLPSYKGPALLPPPPPAAYSWTGCYVDAGAGYGFWNQDHHTSATVPVAGFVSTASTTDGGRGWLGRFGGGCDYQTPWFNNRLVVGVFGDYDVMSLNGSNSPSEVAMVNIPPSISNLASPTTANAKETDAWYVGGRIGYLVNSSFLAFFDGGYTQTRFTQSSEFQTLTGLPIGYAYPNFTVPGWFIGGGAEYALDWLPMRGLFLKTEYRYAAYNNINLTETSTSGAGPSGNVESTKPYVQTVTASLVWRFNWTGR
jgi:outer membrane immunogenic protein